MPAGLPGLPARFHKNGRKGLFSGNCAPGKARNRLIEADTIIASAGEIGKTEMIPENFNPKLRITPLSS